jgi:A/G-specific adenine glycosylase
MVPPMNPATDKLIRWYRANARRLPWRETDDPYAIWVSEVMLQQTRVETVIPYYQEWLCAFPDVTALATAPIDRVLQVWEGLGYYRRAHNLHRAASIVVERHGGRLPSGITALEELPGIGSYTAAAVAAIAFDTDVVAIDGNLRRVLSRLYDIDEPLGSQAAERLFRAHAAELLPVGGASAFNQALMDLGATLCTPSNPNCDACPLQADCLAFQGGFQAQRPVRRARGPLPERRRVAAVISEGGKVLIGRRPQGGLLSGMWEFPGGDLGPEEAPAHGLDRVLRDSLASAVESATPLVEIEHTYTHFRVREQAFSVKADGPIDGSADHKELRWVHVADLPEYPMGKVDRSIAKGLAPNTASH